jgi:site-specific DNA recombinase
MNEFSWKNCLIYTRVSSSTQVTHGNGLQSQETLCRERAKANNVNVIDVFLDGWVSWKYISRAWLDSMIEFLKKENKQYTKIDFVVVDDVDRVIRDVAWRREIKTKIEWLWGAKIHSLKQNITDTPEGNMLQSITMSVKQYERENNARRAKDRKRARMLEWHWVHICPPGYTYTWKWTSKHVIYDDKAPIIKQLLEKYATWTFKNMVEFLYYVEDVWLRTEGGKYFTKNFVFNLLETQRLLFYAGIIHFPILWINMVKAKHEPIISMETMEEIERVKSGKSRHRKFTNTDIFAKMPLRNALACDCCGRLMSGWPSINKMGNYYYYYRCFNKDCPKNDSFNSDQVHKSFEEYLQWLTISTPVLDCFKIALTSIFENEESNLEVWDETRKKNISEITKKIDRLYEMLVNIDSEEIWKLYQQKLNELILEKKKLESQTNNNKKIDIDLKWLLDHTLPIVQNPYQLRLKGDVETRRLVASVVMGGGILYNKKLGITTPNLPSFYAVLWWFSESNSLVSEGTRFELAVPCGTHRFQRCALDHSANLPKINE